MKKKLKVFTYISGWLVTWLALSSIIDAGFISISLYSEGSKGKEITFILVAIISLLGAYSLYREVFIENKIDTK